jgi:carbon monoxide dehydrogenase subunit G
VREASRSAEVAAGAEEVFAFLSDIHNLPRWQSGVLHAELTSPGPVAVGSTAVVERKVLGQLVHADLHVSELEPPRRVVLATDTAGLHVEATVGIEPLSTGRCRVTFGMAMQASGFFMQAVEPMVAQAAEADIGDSLSRLQEIFASPA